ncbi:MAG: hypothetical protein IJ654_05515 [Bacteroidales bacterium]|nr:hypothetical protein [Bacteroidales bacterium]
MNNKIFSVAVLTAASILFFCACNTRFAGEKQAVADKISETMGDVQKLTFNTFEQVGQTTVGEEIEMRINLFKTKLEQDQKFFDMYTAGGVLGKASQKKDAIERDQLHLTQLDSIRNVLSAAQLGAIAYKDYKFSATGTLKDSKLEARDWYAAITPSGEVLSLVQDPKKLHRGLGVTIPGYKGMFDEE